MVAAMAVARWLHAHDDGQADSAQPGEADSARGRRIRLTLTCSA